MHRLAIFAMFFHFCDQCINKLIKIRDLGASASEGEACIEAGVEFIDIGLEATSLLLGGYLGKPIRLDLYVDPFAERFGHVEVTEDDRNGGKASAPPPPSSAAPATPYRPANRPSLPAMRMNFSTITVTSSKLRMRLTLAASPSLTSAIERPPSACSPPARSSSSSSPATTPPVTVASACASSATPSHPR